MLPFPELDFRRTPVTLILAAVAVALEVVCSLDEPRRLHYYNAAFGILPSIWSGEVWRPFTTALMHGSLVHAAFNVLMFVTFGPPLESRFGSFRFLGLVVLLGYLSMLPQFLVSTYDGGPLPMIVGLSGILYGLFGILLVGRRWHLDLAMVCDASTVKFLIVWFFLCILLSYTGLLPVANTAHGAGLLFGVLFGLAIFDLPHRIRWRVLAVVSTLLVLATLIACPGHPYYDHVKKTNQLRQFLQQFEKPA
jgi:GlpG protein